MQEVSTPLPSEPPLIVRAEPTGLFLRVQATLMDMNASYGEQLEATVFPRLTGCDDRKLIKQYRRILRGSEAHNVLGIIWKESEFISDAALAQFELCRAYQGRPLTCHSLAVDLAETPQEVAKLNSRVRIIGIAAAAHQLVDRKEVSSTKIVLNGTKVLHEFMIELNSKRILAVARFVPLINASTDGSRPIKLDGGRVE
jgi:hypothetical protein